MYVYNMLRRSIGISSADVYWVGETLLVFVLL